MIWFKAKPRFVVNTPLHGEKGLSEKELGHCFHQWSVDTARAEIENLFTGTAPEFALVRKIPLSVKIAASPQIAHLLFTARNLAIYFDFISRHLPATTNEDMQGIAQGIRDGVMGVRDGSGKPLSDHIKQEVLRAFGRFVKAFHADLEEMRIKEPSAVGIFASPTTNLLLKTLAENYDDDSYPNGLEGEYSANLMLLIDALNGSTWSIFSMGDGQISFSLVPQFS